MSVDLPPIGQGELALRVARRPPGHWLAVVTSPGGERHAAEAIAADLEGLTQRAAVIIAGEAAARDLAERLRQAPSPVALVAGLGRMTEAAWRQLDFARTRLPESRTVLLVLDAATLSRLVRFAPHLASWLEASTWSLEESRDTLSEGERAVRLLALRARWGLSDADVLSLPDRHPLRSEPDLAEWLVLLGRGDLLDRR